MSGIRLTETARAALDVLADAPGRVSSRVVAEAFADDPRRVGEPRIIHELAVLVDLWLAIGDEAHGYELTRAGRKYQQAMRSSGR